MQRLPVILASVASLIGFAALLTAGPLSPPSGPVAPSYKTLTEVEPRIPLSQATTPGNAGSVFRITQPGSYYLTGNISIPGNVIWGISIEATGVTLDLSGFTIDGNGNQVGAITCSAAGVIIRNGSVIRVNTGILCDFFPSGAPGQTIENIRIIDVLGQGIPPGGNPGAGAAGIFAGRGAIIRNCYVNNAPLGIAAGFNSNVSGCTVEFARQFGFHLQGGASISNCVVVGTSGGPPDGHAYFLGAGSAATNCVARSNSGTGFLTNEECTLTNCTSTNNANGFSIASRGTVRDCTAATNSSTGVLVSGNLWSVTGCSITANPTAGVTIAPNSLHGEISRNFIRGSAPSAGVGIRLPATCTDISIVGNTIGFAQRGVELDGFFSRVTNNFFNNVTSNPVRTSAGAVPDATNVVGPMISSAGTASATSPFSNSLQ